MSNVDYTILEKRLGSFQSESTSSNPPGGGDMESRITNIENNLTEVRVSLGKIETRLSFVDRHMVTKGAMAAWALTIVTFILCAVLGGGWWIIQQYLAPILAKIIS